MLTSLFSSGLSKQNKLYYNDKDSTFICPSYGFYENLDDNAGDSAIVPVNADSNYWGLELSYRFGSPAAPVAAAVVAATPVVATCATPPDTV